MNTLKIPEGYQAVMPYLIVKNAAGLLDFLKKVFGAEEKMKHMREDGTTVAHAEVNIGGSTIMLAESTDQWQTMPAGLFIYVPDADAGYQNALDAGASSVMPPADQEYGRSCGVLDAFGNTWWITSVK